MTQKVQVAFGLAFIQLINVVSVGIEELEIRGKVCDVDPFLSGESRLLRSIPPNFYCQLPNFLLFEGFLVIQSKQCHLDGIF